MEIRYSPLRMSERSQDGAAETSKFGDLRESPPGRRTGGLGRLYFLVFERGASWMFELPDAGEIVVGRSHEVALRLNSSSVSRKHATLLVEGDTVTISDLGSHNGTRVNGATIAGPRVLEPGDTV